MIDVKGLPEIEKMRPFAREVMELPEEKIYDEYVLISQKKSRLPKIKRDFIVYLVHEKVRQEQNFEKFKEIVNSQS